MFPFTERRFWVLAIPLVVYVGQGLGVPITEEVLNGTLDKSVAAIMQVLALWSLARPKR